MIAQQLQTSVQLSPVVVSRFFTCSISMQMREFIVLLVQPLVIGADGSAHREDYHSLEVEINDYPQFARHKVSQKP